MDNVEQTTRSLTELQPGVTLTVMHLAAAITVSVAGTRDHFILILIVTGTLICLVKARLSSFTVFNMEL